MRCIITTGPTYEPLDQVRRLTNFSTGRLGTELADYLADKGHAVTLLRGYYSTWHHRTRAQDVLEFTTTNSLAERLEMLAKDRKWDALFHASAVSDFAFGKVFARSPEGDLQPITSGKFSTRQGTLMAELVPTRKILASLRSIYPQTRLFGWKYEVDGTREDVIRIGRQQITESKTEYCVVNGAAYGPGFGLLGAAGFLTHCPTPQSLYEQLETVALES